MFRNDPKLATDAAAMSAIACDVTELLAELAPQPAIDLPPLRVAYHSACSMQHGQKITATPMTILTGLGYKVLAIPESHICCGSAGTYNLLQPELAGQLQARKLANIESIEPDIIAAGNLGCMIQIASVSSTPVVHTIELVDWATGGAVPHPVVEHAKSHLRPADFIISDAA